MKARQPAVDPISTTANSPDIGLKRLGFTPTRQRFISRLLSREKPPLRFLAKRRRFRARPPIRCWMVWLRRGSFLRNAAATALSLSSARPSPRASHLPRTRSGEKKRGARGAGRRELKTPFPVQALQRSQNHVLRGRAAIENMLYEYTPNGPRASTLQTRHGGAIKIRRLSSSIGSWLEYYWSTKPDFVKIQLISNEGTGRKRACRKSIRTHDCAIPSDFGFSSTIWVCGEYIVLLMTRNEPQYSFQIRDSVFACNLRSVFSLLWQLMGSGRGLL